MTKEEWPFLQCHYCQQHFIAHGIKAHIKIVHEPTEKRDDRKQYIASMNYQHFWNNIDK